jgi:hypothetical protein
MLWSVVLRCPVKLRLMQPQQLFSIVALTWKASVLAGLAWKQPAPN